jgi:hypothetical protein
VSVLDERIRRIAREEVAGGSLTADLNTDPAAELREQLAALTERVTELEKAAAAPAPKRTPRKTTPESSE